MACECRSSWRSRSRRRTRIRLAHLDCFACHHDLPHSRWRQLREAFGTPGRPKLTVGCMPLVAVAAEVASRGAAEQQVKLLVDKLQQPFGNNPLGDNQTFKSEGQTILAGCNSLSNRLETTEFTPELAAKVLHAIAQQAIDGYVDYDTARQLYGAWCVVFEELDIYAQRVPSNATGLSPTATTADFEPDCQGLQRRPPFIFEQRPNSSSANDGTSDRCMRDCQDFCENRINPIRTHSQN